MELDELNDRAELIERVGNADLEAELGPELEAKLESELESDLGPELETVLL